MRDRHYFEYLVRELLRVTADSNLISFGRLYRSAIDHHRHSTDTGQCAIGTVVSLESAGTKCHLRYFLVTRREAGRTSDTQFFEGDSQA